MAEVPQEVKWLELGRGRRRRVAGAVRKGRIVDDPRDAAYAVGFADASLEWLSWKRRFRPLHLMLVALVLAELTLSGGSRPALVLYPLLGFRFLRLRAPRLRGRAQAAREANLKLAAELCLPAVSVKMPGRSLFRPGGLVRRRLMRSLAVAMVVLVALGVTATIWALGQNHRWAGRANLVCAREHARLTALPALRLGPIATQTRTNVIEQGALTGLRRLGPRSRPQKLFVAWREYELKLDVWVLDRLEVGDSASADLGAERIRSAHEHSHKLAGRLGAKTCARA
jgi:hypothetical protein